MVERLDDRRARPAEAIALALELALRVLGPVGHVFSIGSTPCGKPCMT
jgi:hypothetical protein